MNRNVLRAILMAQAILLVSGCNLVLKSPAAALLPADETATKVFVLTAAARTLSTLGGGETQSAAAAHPTATPTRQPTATFTPSITLTTTSEKVFITVSKNTNCRIGPDINFDLVGIMKVGETAEAIGRNGVKTYYVIKLPSNTAKTCWLWYEWATVTGNADALPIIESPPTPTWSPKPDFTFTYVGLTTCPAPKIIRLQIVNTGDIPWESYRVVTTDTVLSIDTTTASDIFKDYSGCSPLAGVPALGPGETGYAIGVISTSSSGHNIAVKLTLYAGNGGSGTHMTGDFSFTMP
jgi:hypothetical protein